MSDNAWLKQVLADAKAAKQAWPAWAKTAAVQTSLNSHPVRASEAPSAQAHPGPVRGAKTRSDLGLK